MAKDFSSIKKPAALSFIDVPAAEPVKEKTAKSKPAKAEPAAEPEAERRTQHIHAIVTPSLYERMQAACWKEHISMNEFINLAIKERLSK